MSLLTWWAVTVCAWIVVATALLAVIVLRVNALTRDRGDGS